MSRPDSGSQEPTNTGSEEAFDPDDFTQRQRLQEIYDARDRLRQAEAEMAIANYPQLRRQVVYHKLLSTYLSLLEPLMTVTFEDTGKEYWEEAELGTATFEPPTDWMDDVGLDSDTDKIIKPPQAREVDFEGLVMVLDAESPYELTFSATVKPRHDPADEFTFTRTVGIPMNVLKSAFRQTNQFLAQIGLDVDPSDEPADGELEL